MTGGYDISLFLYVSSLSFFTWQVDSVSKQSKKTSSNMQALHKCGNITMAKSRVTVDGNYAEV